MVEGATEAEAKAEEVMEVVEMVVEMVEVVKEVAEMEEAEMVEEVKEPDGLLYVKTDLLGCFLHTAYCIEDVMVEAVEADYLVIHLDSSHRMYCLHKNLRPLVFDM
eukprot:4861759-Prymnesium_polylepis.2